MPFQFKLIILPTSFKTYAIEHVKSVCPVQALYCTYMLLPSVLRVCKMLETEGDYPDLKDYDSESELHASL